MGGIKSFLLKSFAFFLLSISYFSLLGWLLVSNIEQSLPSLQATAVNVLSPIFEKAVEKQENSSGISVFDQLKVVCASGLQLNSSNPQKAICDKISSGELSDSASFNKYMSSAAISQLVTNLSSQFYPQIASLVAVSNFLFFVFFVGLFFSIALLFFDNFNLGVFVRTFSFYSLLLSLMAFFSLVVFWFVFPVLASTLVNSVAKDSKLPEEIGMMLYSLQQPFVDWLRAYLFKPLALFAGIFILSLIGWLTGFGLKKEEKK